METKGYRKAPWNDDDDDDRTEPRTDQPAFDPNLHKYCVIGKKVTSNLGRMWFLGADGAVEHAKQLLARQRNNPEELLVVKVIKVVRIPINAEVVDVD